MKKNYKALLFSKISSGSVDFIGGRTTVVKTDFPKRKPRKKRLVKPNLHKIGGMEKDVHNFVTSHVDLSDNNTVILRTRTIDTISHLSNELTALVNLKKVNDVRRVNKFFEKVNSHLVPGALYLGAVEVSEQRKARIYRKLPKSIANIVYTLDFILRRVMPKLNLTKGFLFFSH